MKTYKAKHLFGYERPDGQVDWRDKFGHYVGTTRNGDGYEVLTDAGGGVKVSDK